jgi:PD-(D/E)XK nuclease superfamily
MSAITTVFSYTASPHAYFARGQRLPSVTQTLDDNRLRLDYSQVPPAILARAAERGRAVHQATVDDDAGTFDPLTVSIEVAAYVEAWRAFKRDRRVEIIASERQYVHPHFDYGGTIDRVIRADGARCPVVVDLKTGMHAGTGYQLAGYAELFCCASGVPIVERWAVELHPDRPIPYSVTRFDSVHDLTIFHAALRLTLERRDRGLGWDESVEK